MKLAGNNEEVISSDCANKGKERQKYRQWQRQNSAKTGREADDCSLLSRDKVNLQASPLTIHLSAPLKISLSLFLSPEKPSLTFFPLEIRQFFWTMFK